MEIIMDNQLDNQDFSSPSFKRSRWAYTLECAFEYFVALLVSDVFLATLLSEMGMEDSVIGIISSLISLAFLFQLFSLLIVQHIKNTKLVAVPIHCISQMFFLLLYLLPFLNIPQGLRTAAVIGCILVAYFGNYLVTSVIFNWGNSFVEPSGRANFAATKEIISLLTGIVVSLTMGAVFDRFIAAGNIKGGFIFIATVMLISNVCDFICLMLMKNSKTEKKTAEKSEPFWQTVRILFSNKSFVYTVILHSIWSMSAYMTVGFMGIYKTKELMISVGVVQIINISASLLRAVFSMPIAHYSTKKSYAKGIKLGMYIAAAGYVVNMFTSPSLWWLVILYTILYNVSCAGTGQNLLNLTYSYVDRKYFVQASAIKASISGVCGFLASTVGGVILSAVQANGNKIFGITVYGQQLLSGISLLLLIFGILFVKLVVEKQKVIAK